MEKYGKDREVGRRNTKPALAGEKEKAWRWEKERWEAGKGRKIEKRKKREEG
jgi:hypothetical protein